MLKDTQCTKCCNRCTLLDSVSLLGQQTGSAAKGSLQHVIETSAPGLDAAAGCCLKTTAKVLVAAPVLQRKLSNIAATPVKRESGSAHFLDRDFSALESVPAQVI